jgi:Uma2 family endonuclease
MDVPASNPGFTVDRYFALVAEGVLEPDDRVELLEGVIVSMAPLTPPHASGVTRAMYALTEAAGRGAVLRTRLPLVMGRHSVPEPDVALVPGPYEDYDDAHPRSAILVVEVADSSLKQDRLTKAMIYAAAEVPEFWIVNVVHHQVEVHRDPDRRARRYRNVTVAERGDRIVPLAFPDVSIRVDDLLPTPAT